MTFPIIIALTLIILLTYLTMAIFAYGLRHWVRLEFKRRKAGRGNMYMRKKISLALVIVVSFCLTGCMGNILVKPVMFDQGITDKQILGYAGELKTMYTKVVYGGSMARYGSTAMGRGSSVAAGLLGVAGNASQGVLGILSLVSLGSYEAQDIFDAKGKAMICLYGLQRIESAESLYIDELLKLEDLEKKELTVPGAKLYKTILKTKKVMAKMFMGQVPEKNEL